MPAAIPILEKLHAYPVLRGLATRKGFQSDYLLERRAMLELALGKAMARCGSPQGLSLLIAYLEDDTSNPDAQNEEADPEATEDGGIRVTGYESKGRINKRIRLELVGPALPEA